MTTDANLLESWITLAAHKLPEAERNELLSLLIRSLFANARKEDSDHTIH